MTEPTTVPEINTFDDTQAADLMGAPSDIENFLRETGVIQDSQYRCSLRRIMPDGTIQNIPGRYEGSYPSLDDVGKRYGPGKYQYIFNYGSPAPDGRRRAPSQKPYSVVLSDEYASMHEKFLMDEALEQKKNLQILAQRNENQDIVLGKGRNGKEDPMEALTKTVTILKALGVPVGTQPAPAPVIQDNGLKDMVPLLLEQSRQAASSQMENMKFFMTLMMESNKMMMAAMSGNKNNSMDEGFDKAFGLFSKVMEAKDMLNPPEETLADKIFTLIGSLSAQILPLLAKPREIARQSPLIAAAKGFPEYDELLAHPEAVDALARKMLKKGYKPADVTGLIEVMDLKPTPEVRYKLDQMAQASAEPMPSYAQGATEGRPVQPMPESVSVDEPDEDDIDDI